MLKKNRIFVQHMLTSVENHEAFLTRRFPLFDSHLDLAHLYWEKLVHKGDTVVDATCGNGHDTLFLANLALNDDSGQLFAIDLQEEAISNSQQRLQEAVTAGQYQRIHWIHGSHVAFPNDLKDVALFVYNLGYLPGGDKDKTTQTDTTLASVTQALQLLKPGGAVSITCYPGHTEGEKEQNVLLEYTNNLSPAEWSISFHQWKNRKNSPALLLIQKSKTS